MAIEKFEIPEIVLASGSPRRIEIINSYGIQPEVIVPDVDESLPQYIDMEAAVMFLALKKALSIEPQCREGKLIIAADTIVYLDQAIGKPTDMDDAIRILKNLRGKMHYVATGVALLKSGMPIRRVFCETTKVYFKDYSDDDILQYVATEEPYDKAGGYAIQGAFGKYVDRIEGDYENVIGFPWNRIQKEIKKLEL